MKKNLMTLAAVLCCAMSSMMFTACGSDGDDAPKNDGGSGDSDGVVSEVWSINIKQDISDPELKQGLPVKVCFYDANGEMQVETMTGETWNKTVSYKDGATKEGFCAVRVIENFNLLDDATLEFIVGLDVTGTITTTYKSGKQESIKLEKVVGGYNPYKLGYDNIKSAYDKGSDHINHLALFYNYEDGMITLKTTLTKEAKEKLGLK